MDHGRDFDGADCWGLVMLYYLFALGITLPDYRIGCAFSSMIADKVVEQEKNGPWQEIPEPVENCIVLMALDASQPSVRNHIGVYVGDNRLLHTRAAKGSHTIRLNHPLMAFRLRGYFDFTG